eukprot:10388623-Alexandrium_andersonii.AAC.1
MPETASIGYGLQDHAVQGMLDFDVMRERKKPSVEALVFIRFENHSVKFSGGAEEIVMPYPQSKMVAIIAEGAEAADRGLDQGGRGEVGQHHRPRH